MHQPLVFNPIIPELVVSDLTRSLRFYTAVLGFTIVDQREDEGFAFLAYGAAQLMLEQGPSGWETGKLDYPYGRGMNLEIGVTTLDALLSSLRAHGYPLFRDAQEHWYRLGGIEYGNHEFLVQDPDGYLLRFAQPLGERAIDLRE